VPSLPNSSPPPLNKPSTVTIIRESKTDANKQKRSFMCQICKQAASITQRISIQNQLFHRDCIKCSICNVTVKSAERFTRTDDISK
jgi:hypothetical protein